MALSAQVSVPLPYSPVPLTGQTLALPLVVALLGTRGGTLALFAYLAEGFAGAPVFAPNALYGSSAGYLLAYPIAAYATGRLFDLGLWNSFAGRALAIFCGTLLVFAGGVIWLAHFVGWPAAFALGVVPFIIGDIVKVLLAAGAAPWVRKCGAGIPRL
jgi:biotin transport system substrate-specific component